MEQLESYVKKVKDIFSQLKQKCLWIRANTEIIVHGVQVCYGESMVMQRLNLDHCVFLKVFGEDDFIFLLMYVDDVLIVDRNINIIKELKDQLSESFTTKDMGPAK